MSAESDDAFIVVVQVCENLIVVNKGNEVKEFHFFLQPILQMVYVQKVT